MAHTPPLLVQIVFHPESDAARELALKLHDAINDDPIFPGLHIPTVFVPEDGSGFPPPEGGVDRGADRVLVLVLADDQLTAVAGDRLDGRRNWGDYLVDLYQECGKNRAHRFVPVQLSAAAWPVDPRLGSLNFLRAWAFKEPEESRKLIVRRLVHELCRQLQPARGKKDDSAPPVTIFISHTKIDLDKEPKVVASLLQHLTADQPLATWFDSGDIEVGSQFEKRIAEGIEDAALIAVLTDAYASREWCRKEVLLAKERRRPVVVVDALREREIRSFPYTGNVPVLRWNGDPRAAIDLLLLETLRHLHAQASLASRKEPDDEILPSAPELITLLGPKKRRKKKTILYPDPPLGAEELAILGRTGIKVETPLQRFARRVERLGPGKPIAVSFSESGDSERFGLTSTHHLEAALSVSRYLLLAGARLAYGGHLGKRGYTQRLFELVRAHGLCDVSAPETILNFMGWPAPLSVHDRAELRDVATFRRIPRPQGISESDGADFTPEPDFFPADRSPLHRYAWARGMTEMRQQQTAQTAARVVIGGRVGAAESAQADGTRKKTWYMSRIPGVLEEILVSMQANQPVYLIGAFGGCARLVFDLIEGRDRPEMSWDFQKDAPQASGMREIYDKKGTWWDYPEMTAFLRERGFAGLHNGLDEVENRRLATSRIPEVIVELLLEGLRRVRTPPPLTKED